MPLTVQEGALIGAGMWSCALATLYYRQKKTLPFKAWYFVSWPLLGTAIILAATPDKERLETVLQNSGTVTEKELQDAHERSKQQMAALKEAAGK